MSGVILRAASPARRWPYEGHVQWRRTHLTAASPVPASRVALRTFVTKPAPQAKATSSSFGKYALISGGVLLALGAGKSVVQADSDEQVQSQKSLKELIRAYVVYAMCEIPPLVDHSPAILETLTSIPIVKQLTELFVRITFFDQARDTAEETLPVLQKMRANGRGCLFAYSVEVDEKSATTSGTSALAGAPVHKRIVDEMVHAIDTAAAFEDSILGQNTAVGRKTWVAIKMTALLPDAGALHRLSSCILEHRPKRGAIAFPGCPDAHDLDVLYDVSRYGKLQLTAADVEALQELHQDLIRICTRAAERGVRIILDAEYSWYTPAIDAYTLDLMRRFNKLRSTLSAPVQPLIYATFQAYLRRTPEYLARSFADARAGGYTLGVKLVRGAYHQQEVALHQAKKSGTHSLSISPDDAPPVWETKLETDNCYNSCVKALTAAVCEDVKKNRETPSVGVLFGTHNWTSCGLILDELVNSDLADKVKTLHDVNGIVSISTPVTERLTIGQLYGMADDLSDHIVGTTMSDAPLIIKYVPYGALSEVMPYLGRRAIENKTVLGAGGASAERRRAGEEIRKRIFG
ncbi:FAD-linked oxidoreductase [Fistulina hepatica ATCC 64428]|nr:FAD-linked oxidoreductase [Fistulina hepatica ATCC 64428]